MDWGVTLGVVVGAVGLCVFAGWRGARPPDLTKGPRLAPWRLLMITFAAIALLALTHLVNLMGIETGRR